MRCDATSHGSRVFLGLLELVVEEEVDIDRDAKEWESFEEH